MEKKTRTYKGFMHRFKLVSEKLSVITKDKKDEEFSKEELVTIAKCYKYIARSYYKMAVINSAVSAGSGFSFGYREVEND